MMNKKGTAAVWIMVIFSSMMLAVSAFIYEAREQAVYSSAKALGDLWANSILAEYDRNLQSRYGLFCYYGDEKTVDEKLDMYAGYTFSKKSYIDYEGSSSTLYKYALVNTEEYRKQILKAAKYCISDKTVNPHMEKEREEGCSTDVFSQLPSQGSNGGITVSSVVDMVKSSEGLESIIKVGKDQALIDSYIGRYYRNSMDDRDLGNTYFKGEEEYILFGRKTDGANMRAARVRIVAAREALNLIFLEKSPEKSAALTTAARILTPGPAAKGTRAALAAAWALAESENDYKLLINGKKVPFMKDDESWAVDLDMVVADKENGYIDKDNETGNTYSQYLRAFLAMEDEDIKLLRMMDLVQINMKYLYYDSFSLSDYRCGVSYVMKVNGREHHFEKTY